MDHPKSWGGTEQTGEDRPVAGVFQAVQVTLRQGLWDATAANLPQAPQARVLSEGRNDHLGIDDWHMPQIADDAPADSVSNLRGCSRGRVLCRRRRHRRRIGEQHRGISARQGAHHVAQKFTSTTRPRHACYEERFASMYGDWRPAMREVAEKFLAYGILAHGFARVRCEAADCGHEYLVAFSCKARYFCSSYHAKRLALWTLWLEETLLARDIPHRQVVLTIPRRLRAWCLYRRRLLGDVARVAARTVTAAVRGMTTGTDRASPASPWVASEPEVATQNTSPPPTFRKASSARAQRSFISSRTAREGGSCDYRERTASVIVEKAASS